MLEKVFQHASRGALALAPDAESAQAQSAQAQSAQAQSAQAQSAEEEDPAN
jgi:uncharacterized membrane-anchored protein YhcB (DUF1043 family)